jgi:hypothetical protein
MRALLLQAITVLSNAFRQLEREVPPPNRHSCSSSPRVVTGLKAVDALLANGLLQEVASMRRLAK